MTQSPLDEMLDRLRDLQSQNLRSGDRMGFDEYRIEKNRAPINPGVGLIGHLNTSSRAPYGPPNRPSGNNAVGIKGDSWFGATSQFGVPSGGSPQQSQSQYRFQRPDQPPPWIDDVDMESIWYSPMEPVWPFGPPYYTRPREWNYPVGYNLNYVPQRLELVGMLRGMRDSWGVLSTLVTTRQDQLLRLPWTIQQRDKPRSTSAGTQAAKKFFRKPDGKLTFNQWSRKLLFDLFDIDAPTLYLNRDLGGRLKNVEVLDGGTIFPLIDDAGRRPDSTVEIDQNGITYTHRQPAFQQIIYGLPMVNLSEDEVIYAMMHPLPELPVFGYSPIQQILTEATEAIRKTFYQLEFWRSGSIPELIITVPDNWSPRQIASFQAHFDALLSGQLTLKSKVRFVPGGMKPFDIKNASGESLWSQRDETLIRLACFAFSIPPTPFVKQMNRGTATSQQQTAQEEGLYPLMSWWKDDIMDRIIQDNLGLEDVEFVFLPRPEVDLLKQAQIFKIEADGGLRTRNEIREVMGEEPIDGGDVATVTVGSGVFPLKAVAEGQVALPGAAGSPGHSPAESGSGPRGSDSPHGPVISGSPRPTNSSPQPSVSKATHSEVSSAADEADRNPTHNQLHVGNYRKGHIWIQGLNITIENAKGSKRGEKNKDDQKRQVKMPAPYGYIRGTIGADKMQVDVYIGKHPESPTVWVIDQDKIDPTGADKGFDEHKVMLGYRSLKKAMKDYLKSHFDGLGHDRMSAVTEISVPSLKKWLKDGDMTQPISEQSVGPVVMRRMVSKGFDTISSSTGLNWYDQAAPKRSRRRKKRRKDSSGSRWLTLGAVSH